jgi:hypothetical protein
MALNLGGFVGRPCITCRQEQEGQGCLKGVYLYVTYFHAIPRQLKSQSHFSKLNDEV